MKHAALLLSLLFLTPALAAPLSQMNRAFAALTELIPFLSDREKFLEKKNEALIGEKIVELQEAFRSAKHEKVLKQDLFAPSYALVNENLQSSLESFRKGEKDFAHWRLREITTHCLDCHTRLPPSHTSSFQNGELSIDPSKFDTVYNLGLAQLIVRRYVDAKASFVRAIDDAIIKKYFKDVELPFKQLLLIDTKVLKTPADLVSKFGHYAGKKELPESVKRSVVAWRNRLQFWENSKYLGPGLATEKDVEEFTAAVLAPLKAKPSLEEGNDVDLLFASGLLSNFLFENPESPKAPEISYWLGWAEKHLKRENFFGSGDRFLKQCVRRYPKSPVAPKCLEEYKESVEFDFSGSSGTHIPADVKKELEDLAKLLRKR